MDEESLNLFGRLGISLVIGMFVGLQRELVSTALAGLRTFALIALAGTLSALLDRHFQAGGWLVAANVLAVGIAIGISEWRLARVNNTELGMTTSMAVIVVFGVGAYVESGDLTVAVAIGIAVAALLQFKQQLHGWVHRLGDRDMRAIIQFAVFSGIILPVLPDEGFGPFGVFNPFNIWLMVVLIVGISLFGYIAYKFFGESTGVIASGILGGAISSTATSASFSKRVRVAKGSESLAAAVIVIASTIALVRVMLELFVVAPTNATTLAAPLLAVMVAGLIASAIAWWAYRGTRATSLEPENPSELKSALLFGLLYAFVLWILAFTKHYIGDQGLYGVAVLSGLTDMDAITLSTGRMVEQSEGGMAPELGWRLLVTATISNLIFKSVVVGVVGGRKLFLRVLTYFAIPIGVAVALFFVW